MDGFNNYLRDQSSYIEFTGDKFQLKPMDVFKLSLTDLTQNIQIVTTDIQVQKMQKIYHIKVTISSEVINPFQSGKLILFLHFTVALGESGPLFPREIRILFYFHIK